MQSPSKPLAHHLNQRPRVKIPQETTDTSVFLIALACYILKKFLITSIRHDIIWKTSRGGKVLPPDVNTAELAFPFRTYCDSSWKHFAKSQLYIVAPKSETTGPSNHTKQLCPWKKGHLLQPCFFLLLKKCQAMFYAVLMTGCCLLYQQAAITSGWGNCHYLESIYLSDLQERWKLRTALLRSGSKDSLTVSYNISNIFVRPIKPEACLT